MTTDRPSKKKSIYTAKNDYVDRNSKGPSSFQEVNLTVRTMETNILLLYCEEDEILAAILHNLVEYVRKQPDNVDELRKRNVIGALFQRDFFMDNKNFLIKRLTLYLTCTILEDFKLGDLETDFTTKLLEVSVRFYLAEEEDDFVIEYLTVIINRILTDPQVVYLILDLSEFLEKFYSTVNTSVNPDIILNSLEAIEKMLKVQNYDQMIYFATDHGFSIDRILCELTSDVEEISIAALKIIKLLITDTSVRGVFCKPKRCIFALKQLMKMLFRKDFIDYLELMAIDVLSDALLTERMVRYFFEQNLFEKLVMDIQTREDKYNETAKCKVMHIFSECCKYEQYLQRIHNVHVTDWFLDCLLDNELPPGHYILTGLNRLMKFNEAANAVLAAYIRGVLPRLLEIMHTTTFPTKTREQAAELINFLIEFNLHKTAQALNELGIGDVLSDIFNQEPNEISIDLIIAIINIIESLCQNSEYREILGVNEILISRMDLLLKKSFAHAILVNNLLRCLGVLCEENTTRKVLLENFFPYSLNKALKSVSALVKSTATNLIMRTCRFSEFVEMFIDGGILETLIMNQKHSHCLPTWSNAIDYILAKCPSLKFQIRQHLDFIDTTKGSDFLVAKKKLDDFRLFLKVLKEECSPKSPIFVINFERPISDPDTIVEVPPDLLTPEEKAKSPEGWCYCRQPGDEKLPEMLNTLNERLRHSGVIDNDTVKPKRCIDFDKIAKHAKLIAELIAEKMSKDLQPIDLNASEEDVNKIVSCYLKVITLDLHCNFIPIGLLENGGLYERAILFKALADQTGLPCTLSRTVDNRVLFNEIPLPVEMERDIHCDAKTMHHMPWRMLRPTHVVDLFYHVGCIYPLQSRQALQYLRLH